MVLPKKQSNFHNQTANKKGIVYRKPSPVGKVDATKEQTDEENGIDTTIGEHLICLKQRTAQPKENPWLRLFFMNPNGFIWLLLWG